MIIREGRQDCERARAIRETRSPNVSVQGPVGHESSPDASEKVAVIEEADGASRSGEPRQYMVVSDASRLVWGDIHDVTKEELHRLKTIAHANVRK
jgi:hypothetical protein